MVKRVLNINDAIIKGIGSIIEEHPRLQDFEEYFLKHIDKKKIRENIEILAKKVRAKNLSEEDAYMYIHREIADYVSSGEAFDRKGKGRILKGLEGKAEGENFFKRIFSRPKFDGEKYLDETMDAFNDLYLLFRSGNYAKRMPELAKSLETLYDLKFFIPAIDILGESGMIDKRKYEFLKKTMYAKTQEASKEVVSGIEKYAVPEKIAASILGIFGVSLIITSSKITGAVIGISNNIISTFIGGCMVLVALLIFNLSRKKIKK